MGCGCGQSPKVWQPASQAQQQQTREAAGQNPNAAVSANQTVWPKAWTGTR